MGAADLAVMRILADLAGRSIERDAEGPKRRAESIERVRGAMNSEALMIVYQPIVDLRTGLVAGYECLTRFYGEPKRGPDQWFAEADAVGLGVELELFAAKRGLRALSTLPGSVYLGINLSPASLLDRRLYELLAQWPAKRIVFEVTEHHVVDEYDALTAALEPLRRSGAKVAVDDAGAGYASFRHILRLQPDYIKLDISLTRGIDKHPGQRALAGAITDFGNATGSIIVAEGVETEGELKTLRELNVRKAQGYFFGKPAPLDIAEKAIDKRHA
jgi:EAL domain-containing protein (putative c-di-GMP-specific phosphodiesterase class I)